MGVKFFFFLIALVSVLSIGVWFYSPNSHPLYAFQESYSNYGSKDATQYKIAVVTDMDTDSKIEGKSEWRALLKLGSLTRTSDGKYSVAWNTERELTSKYNEGGRGMELSELVFWNGKLLSCDDRTGIVFEIDLNKFDVYPRYIFGNGDGSESKGFKCEWMFVRDDKLYVGSMGKDWTTPEGKFVNDHPNWVKIVDPKGTIEAINWSNNFRKISESVGITDPDKGYMVHESVNWDYSTRTWVFMPRRVGFGAYDDKADGNKGSNHVFTFPENFSKVQVNRRGHLDPTHGFSSAKFFPYRPHEIVALKTVETESVVESYIMVFNIQSGVILMNETLIGEFKYEGVEFI